VNINIYSKIFIVLSVLLLSSCAASDVSLDRVNDKTLRIATSFRIQALAPHDSASYFLVEYAVAETPLFVDDEAAIKPNLLASYERIDERNWKLVIREGLSFQNGRPVTAEAFAAAMNFQVKNSPATQNLLPNASVKASGDQELVLTTEIPNPNVPAVLADESGFPIFDVECIEGDNYDTRKIIEGGCYTGPYKIASLDEREMVLRRSENYWRGNPPLDQIVVKFVPDAQVRILAVQSNEADIALYPPAETGRMLAGQTNAFFVVGQESKSGPRLLFNIRQPPFNDQAIRRAVSLGFRYQSLATDTFDGIFQVADGFYPPTYTFAVQNQKTDIAEANRLLDDSGWKTNEGGLRSKNGATLFAVLLTYPQQPDWVILATALQAQLREIGFDVTIRQVDDIKAAMGGKDWNFGIISPGITTHGGAPEPPLREFLSSTGERNFGGVNDPELDRLIETLGQTFDLKLRNEILQRIQEIIIVEKAYEVRPVYSRPRVVVGKRFRNYKPSPHLRHLTFDTKPADE
jgi:peptide/nickel transport system substrate-binding protein